LWIRSLNNPIETTDLIATFKPWNLKIETYPKCHRDERFQKGFSYTVGGLTLIQLIKLKIDSGFIFSFQFAFFAIRFIYIGMLI